MGHYEELSVAFLRFKNKEYRRIAMDILSQKQYDEELLFSQHILLSEEDQEEKKEREMEIFNSLGLGWYHRVLTRCCCNAHHPHLAQDKLILIQNENIINRNIMYDLSLLKKELDKMKQRELSSNKLEETDSLSLSDKVSIDIKPNKFGGNQKKQNKFDANTKVEKKGTNNDKYFGANNKKQKQKKGKSNNFGPRKQTKKNSFQEQNFGQLAHLAVNNNKNLGDKPIKT